MGFVKMMRIAKLLSKSELEFMAVIACYSCSRWWLCPNFAVLGG